MFTTATLVTVGIGVVVFVQIIRFLKHFGIFTHYGQANRNNEISLSGKIVLITGANTGIGKETALEIVSRGATVILGCRNLMAAREAMIDIGKQFPNAKMIAMELDLSSLKSVREFAKTFKSKYDKLDILINNAGVYKASAEKRETTEDGFEIHMGVNHLGHFLLTQLLLEPLKKAAPSRIVTVSSMVHLSEKLDLDDLMSEKRKFKNSTPNPLYCNSKFANVLFTHELAKRLENTGVKTYVLCPGIVRTDIFRDPVPLRFIVLAPIFLSHLKESKAGVSNDTALQFIEGQGSCGKIG